MVFILTYRDRTLDKNQGQIIKDIFLLRVHLYRPFADEDILPVLINFHGGGFVKGSWQRYYVIGWGTHDTLSEDGKVHDSYRNDYLKAHLTELKRAICEGVLVISYNTWIFIVVVSSQSVIKTNGRSF